MVRDSSGPLEVRYDLVDTGDVIDGEGTDLSATILDTTTSIGVPVTTKTSDTDYGSDAGVELTLRSARQYDEAMYRVGSPDTCESWRNQCGLPALGELSIASLVDETFMRSDIFYTVTLDPAPLATNSTVSIAGSEVVRCEWW